ncbi:porin [Trinickia caryophylli]|uniref:Porin, GBP family n=1 Tax=Trinickia caryophylli TaxID=28094 RepID=A0A1X7H7Z5_TRICW|nr:porin [Trinickia caryophylli]PMS09476.1 porin [Trinickia caryophylli]TRX14091.1 porin [Trinickia caryophylli]WQE13911.1 porin [Trinickia caryophylli]SMF81396.1 porin, GBP family [Trinickia caryophylli]GLU35746.1 porin [Trinickia caryophylli]
MKEIRRQQIRKFIRVNIPIAIAVLTLFATTARAENSVTLYGIIDSGLMYVSNQNGHSNYETTTGKLSGSRFGFKGNEDLGGGYNAFFVLENGFSANSGALQQGSRLFGRQGYVGIGQTSLGKIMLGRQYSPFELYVGYLTAGIRFGTSLMTDPFDLNMLGGSVRFNNAVTYESPDYRGLTYSVQYAFSNQAASAGGLGFANNREFGAAIKYLRGGLRAAIGYARLDGPNAASNTNGATYGDYPGAFPLWFKRLDSNLSGKTSSAALAIGTEQVITAGGLYRIGNIELGSVISRTLIGKLSISGASTPDFNTANGRFDIDSLELSASDYLTPSYIVGLMGKFSNASLRTGAGDMSLHWWQFGLGNDYLLSKRTDVYAALAYESAAGRGNAAQITLDAPSSNSHQVAFTVGLRHRF